MQPLTKDLLNALNEQMNFERFSADVYEDLASKLDCLNWVGMASYMRKRSSEERGHYGKFRDFVIDRNETPVYAALDAIDKPVLEPLTAFELALKHEKLVTERIENLYELSHDERDVATCIFLQWFVSEQVEEERSLYEIVGRFKAAASLLLMDKELGG